MANKAPRPTEAPENETAGLEHDTSETAGEKKAPPSVAAAPEPAVEEKQEVPASNTSSPPTNTPTGPDNRNVVLLLPQHKTTNPLTLMSLLGLRDPRTNAAIVHYGDAFIVHTRNRLVQSFLTDTKAEWALFIDDDMVLPFGNAGWFRKVTGFGNLPEASAGANTIERLLAARKTLVGGLYFGRHPGPRRAMFAESANYSGNNFASLPQNKVVQTQWVGTGCMLVHRSVFLDIQTRNPHLAPKSKGEPWQFFSAAADSLIRTAQQVADGTKTVADLRGEVQRAQTANLGMGEDVLFCHRAAAAGHPAHVDLGLLCGHIGHAVYGDR